MHKKNALRAICSIDLLDWWWWFAFHNHKNDPIENICRISIHLIAFYIAITIIIMNKITILTKTMNFRKLLLAALPVMTAIIISIAITSSAECISHNGGIVCW